MEKINKNGHMRLYILVYHRRPSFIRDPHSLETFQFSLKPQAVYCRDIRYPQICIGDPNFTLKPQNFSSETPSFRLQ